MQEILFVLTFLAIKDKIYCISLNSLFRKLMMIHCNESIKDDRFIYGARGSENVD